MVDVVLRCSTSYCLHKLVLPLTYTIEDGILDIWNQKIKLLEEEYPWGVLDYKIYCPSCLVAKGIK